MAKKEYVKITSDGLKLLTIMNYSYMTGISGFYGTECFFTKGFEGDTQYLRYALGNLGAFAQDRGIEPDISVVIIGNKIIENPTGDLYREFISDFEAKLNQDNSPYRRLKLITENHLVWYIESRAKSIKDEQLTDFLKKYKSSKKEIVDTKSIAGRLF
jgi:hypothetical protein